MFRNLSWSFAVLILSLFIFTELLPIIFSVGEHATWDWSFLYVTIKFIALPILCFIHIGINVTRIIKSQKDRLALIQFSSILIPVGYIVLLYLYQLPLFI